MGEDFSLHWQRRLWYNQYIDREDGRRLFTTLTKKTLV